MKKLPLLLTLPLLIAFGCDPQPKEATKAGTPAKTPSVETQTPVAATGGDQAKPAPTATLDQIPESLKHDAYHYYGLGNPTPMNMEIIISDRASEVYTGTQAIVLKEIKDGKPIFTIDRTGQLASLGSQELRLEADGLYNSASSIAKIGTNDIELPAKLTPGSTWKSHAEISQSGQSIINDSVLKVVGPEKVKTKAGEHDALLITSTGQSTIGGKKAKTTSKNWYVKDLGVVKSVLVNTYPDGKVQTITIQETK